MGLAIIGFSLVLRFVLSPLTKQYMESMKKMKEHAPALEKLKAKHKDDKQKLLTAQADFYREKGIKPGGGCLPYLLQIIILITFFRLFVNVFTNGDVASAFNNFLYEPLKFSEGEAINLRFLYLNIKDPDVIRVAALPFALPGPVILLAGLVQGISAKVMQPQTKVEAKVAGKSKGTMDDFQTAMQNSAIYTFPVVTILAGMRFPSGLALYWLTFSAYQTVQQLKAVDGGVANLLKWQPWKKSKK